MNDSPLALYGRDYCVIDMQNLFVGTTLEDELLILRADDGLASGIRNEGVRFGLHLEPGRRLDSCSGGEQAIVCCLLLTALLPKTPVRILLVHVLETLSPRNRELILNMFQTARPEASLFTMTQTGPMPMADHV